MILFTYAFSHTSNYTVPILIQKLQPLIAIILARLLLRESWQKGFGLVLIFALSGAVLISWPAQGQGPAWQGQDFLAIAAAFGAALTWGGSTVAGRHLISKFGFLEITAVRYFMAFLILLPVIGLSGGAVNLGSIPLSDWGLFLMMAWGPGYLALIIFYKGLSGTQASVATLCELAFPVGAVLINWVFLDSPLSGQQILGAVLLVGSVTWLSYSQARLQRRAVVETPFERMILGCKKK